MAVFKCKMCGGTLEITEGATVAECEYCGSQQTLPKVNDEALENLYNRANALRMKSEFDKAEEIYNKILTTDSEQAEAYWGIILCKYGIEYVEDPATFKRVPTCHRSSFESITADDDYKNALNYADMSQKAVYEAEAKAIEEIQKGILAISRNEKPYDVFICYKETDANGKRTTDSVIANDIYHQLTQEGFKVFYAAITLEDKLGQEYEPYIFAALNSAKVMLVIGSRPEYFTAVWVRNEWSRFLKIMKKDRSKLLIPCYKDMDAYELPEEFAHLQAQDMSKIGFINDVIRGIKKVIVKDEPKPAVKETVVVQNEQNGNIAPLLKRAFMALEDGEWDKADDFCEQVLNIDPECAEAYLGKLMAELNVRNRDGLKNCAEPFDNKSNYKKAIRFADNTLKAELEVDNRYIRKRNETLYLLFLIARKTKIYNKAVEKMRSASSETDFMQAANEFKTIHGFKDSDELEKKCLEKAEICKQERLAKEEAYRIAAEKAAKKKKKITAIVMSSIAAVVAFVIVLNVAVEKARFEEEQLSKYNNAVSLMNDGKYDEAISAFTELGSYSDSAMQIENCNYGIKENKYQNAISLMNNGKYDEAITAFTELGSYSDSRVKLSEICHSSEYLKQLKVGDVVYFGAYEQDNNTSNGQEEIEWVVLDKQDGKALIISKYGLDTKPYNTEGEDVTWETCTLRSWLNNEFYNSAFTAEEKGRIEKTTVVNNDNANYGTKSGNNTQDNVFLLSIDEANKYFSSKKARMCAPTKYAIANGADTYDNCNVDGKSTGFWWLRSPGTNQYYAAGVYCDGSVLSAGDNVDDDDCVRPALWINI